MCLRSSPLELKISNAACKWLGILPTPIALPSNMVTLLANTATRELGTIPQKDRNNANQWTTAAVFPLHSYPNHRENFQ